MAWHLICIHPKADVVVDEFPFSIGRDPENQKSCLIITNQSVSRNQFSLELRQGGLYYRNLSERFPAELDGVLIVGDRALAPDTIHIVRIREVIILIGTDHGALEDAARRMENSLFMAYDDDGEYGPLRKDQIIEYFKNGTFAENTTFRRLSCPHEVLGKANFAVGSAPIKHDTSVVDIGKAVATMPDVTQGMEAPTTVGTNADTGAEEKNGDLAPKPVIPQKQFVVLSIVLAALLGGSLYWLCANNADRSAVAAYRENGETPVLDAAKSKTATYASDVEIEAEILDSTARNHDFLVARADEISRRLKSEFMSPELSDATAEWKSDVFMWREACGGKLPAFEAEIDAVEKIVEEAENLQSHLGRLIKRMKNAAAPDEYLSLRKELLETCSSYPFVAALGDHPVSPDDVVAVVRGSSYEQQSYENMLESSISGDDFRDFLQEKVMSLERRESYCSLFGIVFGGDKAWSYFAICNGRPEIEQAGGDCKIDGDLLDLGRGEMVWQILLNADTYGNPAVQPLTSTREVRSLAETACKPDLTWPEFEREILKRISVHLKIAADKDFLKNEIEIYGKQSYLATGRYPAIRRVQMVKMYLGWLEDDLGIMPAGDKFHEWLAEVAELAAPVQIDGVLDELTWTCMKDIRVRERNADCAKFLRRMSEAKFVDEYRLWRSARFELRRPLQWNIEYAGNIALDPYDGRMAEGRAIAAVADGVAVDHPLYVLRRENGLLAMKRILIPGNDGRSWEFVSPDDVDIVPGDPLFQFVERGKCIDAEKTFADILSEMPGEVAEFFADKMPFFRRSGGQDARDAP